MGSEISLWHINQVINDTIFAAITLSGYLNFMNFCIFCLKYEFFFKNNGFICIFDIFLSLIFWNFWRGIKRCIRQIARKRVSPPNLRKFSEVEACCGVRFQPIQMLIFDWPKCSKLNGFMCEIKLFFQFLCIFLHFLDFEINHLPNIIICHEFWSFWAKIQTPLQECNRMNLPALRYISFKYIFYYFFVHHFELQ